MEVTQEADEIFAIINRIYSRYTEEINEAKNKWPSMPSGLVLKLLGTRGKFPEDWEKGKSIQTELYTRENPYRIPYKTECEMGAGLWDRLTKGEWRNVQPKP